MVCPVIVHSESRIVSHMIWAETVLIQYEKLSTESMGERENIAQGE